MQFLLPALSVQLEIASKLLLASIFGAAIGLDRARRGKVAGPRTQMLVCAGSALITSISVNLNEIPHLGDSGFLFNPAGLMGQIVTGVGFIGAGVIIKSPQRVTGLTTAAIIWTTSAIGIAIGTGFYLPASLGTFLALMLGPLARIQFGFGLKRNAYILVINYSRRGEVFEALEDTDIKEVDRSLKGKKFYLTILSSEQKNLGLRAFLENKRIRFSIERLEGGLKAWKRENR